MDDVVAGTTGYLNFEVFEFVGDLGAAASEFVVKTDGQFGQVVVPFAMLMVRLNGLCNVGATAALNFGSDFRQACTLSDKTRAF